jgi:hypothetical protein
MLQKEPNSQQNIDHFITQAQIIALGV